MTPEVLAGWLLGVMVATAPPGRSRFPTEARETPEDGRARYAAIAHAVAEVALDPDERPLFSGDRARERTAALLLSISWHESGWRRDVDLGIGSHARGGGRYHCVMQVAVDRSGRASGWTAAQ